MDGGFTFYICITFRRKEKRADQKKDEGDCEQSASSGVNLQTGL